MKKAEATGAWPAYPAKITSAEVVTTEDSDGQTSRYLDIKGKFLDTGEPFTARRWAYGAVNGLSPHQPYLAPYEPGYVTTVYVDPAAPANVILCNDPSLTGNAMFMGGSAAAVIGILCWVLYGRKKWEAYRARKAAAEPFSTVRSNQSRELPMWAGVLIGVCMILIFLGLGIWMIYMGIIGETLAEELAPNEAKILILVGMLFAFGGIMGLVMAIFNGNPPPILNKIVLSLFLLFLGLPFIAIPILDPDRISSSASAGGFVIHESQGSSFGAVVFMLAGLGCLVGAFWPWRWWKK